MLQCDRQWSRKRVEVEDASWSVRVCEIRGAEPKLMTAFNFRPSKVPSTLHDCSQHGLPSKQSHQANDSLQRTLVSTDVYEQQSTKANPLQPRYLRTSIHISSRSIQKRKTPNAHALYPWPHGRYQVLSGIFHRIQGLRFQQKVINHASAVHLEPLTW